jgi:hypothetical protein
MKTKNRQFLALSAVLALTLSIAVTSCKKDKDDNNASTQISATVGADAFKSAYVTGAYSSGLISVGGVAKVGSDSASISLTFRSDAEVNKAIDWKNVYVGYYKYSGQKSYSSQNSDTHGTFTATSIDKTNKKVSGTFSGVVYGTWSSSDSVVIKDGKFSTSYISQ